MTEDDEARLECEELLKLSQLLRVKVQQSEETECELRHKLKHQEHEKRRHKEDLQIARRLTADIQVKKEECEQAHAAITKIQAQLECERQA